MTSLHHLVTHLLYVLGVVAAMMVVVFAILVVKKSGKKSNRFSNTYLEVSSEAPELSPEDRHIAVMQVG